MREPLPILVYALMGKLTGNAVLVFQYAQLIFDLLILWGILLLTHELSNQTLALLAAFIWTFYLPLIRVEVHINGDLISGVCVTWGMLLFVKCIKNNRLMDWIGFGTLFGFAALSRSATLVIVFVLLFRCGLLWLTKNRQVILRFKDLAAATIALAIVFSPWVIRNLIVFDQPIIGTTLIGYNLYRHNAIVVGEIFPHYIGPVEAQKELQALISRHPELQTPLNEAQVDQIFRQEALQMIRAYPEEYVELVTYRFIPLWFNIGVLEQYGEAMTFVDDIVVVQQFILMALFLVVLWTGNWMHRLITAGLFLFMFSYMAVDSQLRYLMPILPVVVSMCVLSFGYLFPKYFQDDDTRIFDPGLLYPRGNIFKRY